MVNKLEATLNIQNILSNTNSDRVDHLLSLHRLDRYDMVSVLFLTHPHPNCRQLLYQRVIQYAGEADLLGGTIDTPTSEGAKIAADLLRKPSPEFDTYENRATGIIFPNTEPDRGIVNLTVLMPTLPGMVTSRGEVRNDRSKDWNMALITAGLLHEQSELYLSPFARSLEVFKSQPNSVFYQMRAAIKSLVRRVFLKEEE